MAIGEGARIEAAGAAWPRGFELACFAVVVAFVAFIVAGLVGQTWPTGAPIDFLNVVAAGRLTLDGMPEAAYDPALHKAAEVAAHGANFTGYFPWHYPPHALFAAAAFALTPFVAALALWLALTFAPYLLVIRAIVGSHIGLLYAAAFPAVLANAIAGQNGFVTAALIGGALLCLEKRPILAGILIGLLTYKPHFGLLFPVILIAGGHSRALIAATMTAASLILASLAAFGVEPWSAFLHTLTHASQDTLTKGMAGLDKLQSVYALARYLGATDTLAWTAQAIATGAGALLVAILWRRDLPFAMKAAVAGTAALIASPYLFLYDMVALAVPVAFLLSTAARGGFLSGELLALALAALLILAFPFITWPLGPVVMAIVLALALRRVRAGLGHDRRGPPRH